MIVILYTTQRFDESLKNYILLDQRYQKEIRSKLNNSSTIKFLEHENA